MTKDKIVLALLVALVIISGSFLGGIQVGRGDVSAKQERWAQAFEAKDQAYAQLYKNYLVVSEALNQTSLKALEYQNKVKVKIVNTSTMSIPEAFYQSGNETFTYEEALDFAYYARWAHLNLADYLDRTGLANQWTGTSDRQREFARVYDQLINYLKETEK